MSGHRAGALRAGAALLFALAVAGCGGDDKHDGGGLAGLTRRQSPAPSPLPTATARVEPSPSPSPAVSPSPVASPSPSLSPLRSPAASSSPTTVAGACDDATAAARLRPSVVHIDTGGGTGTGIIAANGLVLTAEHVVSDVRLARLTFAGGRTVDAEVLSRRPAEDLALLRVQTAGAPVASFGDERALRPGQPLLALGFARNIPGEPSLTGGRFSALRTGDATLVQTDTPLNPGNSGGPIFTQCGEVVGVVSFQLADAQGISFGVAASHARAFVANPSSGATPRPASPLPSPPPASPPPASAPPRTGASPAPPTGAQRSVVVTKRYGAAVRASPSSDAQILTVASCGAVLAVAGASGGWTQVVAQGQVRGWVGDARIADAARPPAFDCSGAVTYRPGDGATTRVQSGCLSLRDRPSRQGAILHCVENGTRYTVENGPIDVEGEDWLQVNSPSLGRGWVLVQFLVPVR